MKIIPYYDRSALIEETTSTVEENLIRGMVLVLVVLGIFLFNIRAAIIVAITIPFALMFSFICLDWRHIPANLLSIGAIDFGILVDGAVVMVENVFRELAAREGEDYDLIYVIRSAAKDVERPIFSYAVAGDYRRLSAHLRADRSLRQIISADGGHHGVRLGRIGDLRADPAAGFVFLPAAREDPRAKGVVLRFYPPRLRRLLGWCLRNRTVSTVILLSVFAASLLLIPLIGAEFMPHLDEGALWMRATAPYTISFEEASKLSPQIRDILRTFPQVTTVANELGRPDDGTDSTGFFNNEYYIGLKPYSDSSWSNKVRNKKQLVDAINEKMSAFPGVIFNFTQPAEDAVDEAETGLKSLLAVKIFGGDLATLEDNARKVKRIISKVPGIVDITVVRELGQPSLIVTPNRDKIAQYGLNVDDVNTMIETAMGGKAASQVIQGERQFDLLVRMQEPYRKDADAIRNLLIATPNGQYLPLSQFADIKVDNGASFIYRESNSRFIGVQFSVRNRDLAGAVEEARREVDKQMKLTGRLHIRLGRRI